MAFLQVVDGPDSEPPPDDFEHTDADSPNSAESGQEQRLTEQRHPLSVLEVLDQWRAAGPLVHEPTGIKALDEHTGGGPVYGTRWFLPGAPDAGKTLLMLVLAHVWAKRGVTVGMLAIDEEPGDIVTRLAQRAGYARHHCEARDPAVLTELQHALGGLQLQLYDDQWTIEAAAADLAARADGGRAALFIDSVQTAKCEKDIAATLSGREMSEVAAVTARVQAIRAVATRHRLIAMATSEQGRGAYRSGDPTQQTTGLASGKWSGAIEYGAKVQLVVRSVPDETDLIEVELSKNKHGPRDVKLHLRIDRRAQSLTEVRYEPAPDEAPAARKAAKFKAEAVTDAAAVVATLEKTPGLGVRQLRSAMRAASGIGSDRVDAAVALLGVAVTRQLGPNKSQLMSVDRAHLPEAVRHALEGSK